MYINTGHYLLNIKKIKSEKMYEKFAKYKEVYISGIAEQDLLNDIAIGKIGYLPVKYGVFSPHSTDQNSDTINLLHNFYFYNFIEINIIFLLFQIIPMNIINNHLILLLFINGMGNGN